ncbi:MAG: hypothetical protein SF051_13305, partial [Elusimicrobiota bacterium]|nr:hypothetical protein [Elusimicrobiota bacterium]
MTPLLLLSVAAASALAPAQRVPCGLLTDDPARLRAHFTAVFCEGYEAVPDASACLASAEGRGAGLALESMVYDADLARTIQAGRSRDADDFTHRALLVAALRRLAGPGGPPAGCAE